MAEKGFNNYLMPNGDYMLPLELPTCPLCKKQHGANQKNLLNICANGAVYITCNVRPGDFHPNPAYTISRNHMENEALALALNYQDDQIPVFQDDPDLYNLLLGVFQHPGNATISRLFHGIYQSKYRCLGEDQWYELKQQYWLPIKEAIIHELLSSPEFMRPLKACLHYYYNNQHLTQANEKIKVINLLIHNLEDSSYKADTLKECEMTFHHNHEDFQEQLNKQFENDENDTGACDLTVDKLPRNSGCKLPLNQPGYIYIARLFSAAISNLPYYKIGSTDDWVQRRTGYEKGVVLLYIKACDDHKTMETALHKALRHRFQKCDDRGRETYWADYYELETFIDQFIRNIPFDSSDIITPTTKQMKDLSLMRIAQQQQKQNDEWITFRKLYICNEYGGYGWTDLYEIFRKWYISNVGCAVPGKKLVKRYFEKHYGPCMDTVRAGKSVFRGWGAITLTELAKSTLKDIKKANVRQ